MDYVIDLLDNDEEVNGLILACDDELGMRVKAKIVAAVGRVHYLDRKRGVRDSLGETLEGIQVERIVPRRIMF